MPPTFDVECQSLNESIAGLFASVIVEANRVNQNNENPVIDYLQFDIQDHRNHLQPSVFKPGVRKSFHWDSGKGHFRWQSEAYSDDNALRQAVFEQWNFRGKDTYETIHNVQKWALVIIMRVTSEYNGVIMDTIMESCWAKQTESVLAQRYKMRKIFLDEGIRNYILEAKESESDTGESMMRACAIGFAPVIQKYRRCWLVSVLNLFSRVEFLHRMLSEPLRNMVDIVQQHGSEEQFDAFDGPGGQLCPRFPVEFVTFCTDAGYLDCQQKVNGTYCSRMKALELFVMMLSHSEVKFYDNKQRSTQINIKNISKENFQIKFPLEGYFVRHARPVRYRRCKHRPAMPTEELFAWLRKQCASFGAQAGLLTLSKGKSSHACMFTVCDGNIVVCNHRHCFQDGRPIGKKKGGGYFASGKEFKSCNLLLLADGGERGEGSNQNTQPPQTRKRRAAQKGPPKTPKNAKKQRTNDGAYETSRIIHNARQDCPSKEKWTELLVTKELGELEEVASVCHHLPYRSPLVKYSLERMVPSDTPFYQDIWNQMCPWAWAPVLETGDWYLLRGYYQGQNARVQRTTIDVGDNTLPTFPRKEPVVKNDTVGMIVARVVTPTFIELTYLCAYKRFGVGMVEEFLSLIPTTVAVVLRAGPTYATGFWKAMGFWQFKRDDTCVPYLGYLGTSMMRYGTDETHGEPFHVLQAHDPVDGMRVVIDTD